MWDLSTTCETSEVPVKGGKTATKQTFAFGQRLSPVLEFGFFFFVLFVCLFVFNESVKFRVK